MKSTRSFLLIIPLLILSGCYYSKYERLSEQPAMYSDTVYYYNESGDFYSSNYFVPNIVPVYVPVNINPQTAPAEK